MKQYESCIQNNNNKKKKRKKRKSKKKKGLKKRAERASGGESVGEREYYFYFFLLFVSFADLRKSDCKGLKAKLIYATRATREYQNLGVLSNSTR